MTRKQLFLVTGAMVLALGALTSTQSNDPLDWSGAVVHTVENVGKTEARVLRIELKY